MSQNGRHDLLEANGLLDEALAMLVARYERAKQAESALDLLIVMVEAQLLQVQIQMRALAATQETLALAGWTSIPTQPTQVSVGTSATLLVDLEAGERTVVDLYIHDPTNAAPVAFGGPGVTFNQGHIMPAGVILPVWPLTESLYAVAQSGTVTISVRRRG